MYFYTVLPSSLRYHGSDALTYSSVSKLSTGNVVIVPLQGRDILGIVTSEVTRPDFKVKEAVQVVETTPLSSHTLALLYWLKDYYPAPLGSIVTQFLPTGLLHIPKKEHKTSSNSKFKSNEPLPPLTTEQKQVMKSISSQSKNHSSWLLHGETGSGKTRIYLELAMQTIDKGQSVLVLTPEIGLSPQLAKSFSEAFRVPVLVFHSNLSSAQRRNIWLQILNARSPLVVIGPRSALFSPLKQIGLVVVDETHESAYKQEQSPHYYAPRVAAKLARIHKAKLISGTATPNISDYYSSKIKDIPILRMQKLAVKSTHNKPKLHLVDLRDRTEFSRHPYLSDALLSRLQTSLGRNEQSLIFLNRRGSARLVICQSCGWQARCRVCDLSLTYHQDNHILRCHTCGYMQASPTTCPTCGSSDIIFKSAGTKAITDALQSIFPKARVQRFDTDNSAAEKLERHYETILNGEVDILVGTQMLGKGLDLPKLAFVGVVSADTSLHFPDYTSEERTYQLLSQIIGRIGRGHRQGSAVIQTFQPKSPAILAAINKDWQLFYDNQLMERSNFGFPPFFHLLKLTVARKSPKAAQTAATTLSSKLKDAHLRIKIIGPTPSFYEKWGNTYRWQLIIKAKDRGELIKTIHNLPANWSYDIDPINLL